ncbi:bifunctional phosphopantothenoylcysteine decarboxylase/phosphopantothenate--cysteine ligase CoaBC [Candidatus Soleaferrea massiliensis]|uniref:bifunctional phosphopantothenoylcysteine decarboxylase/phosphopantothenate--cysteine ligase CoaBC n=1 Tax=Candidatus Soleaferrea massiliensis TaxID=1470354 RepID=UPI00058C2561|nr:bifunctional phosphopantothenoylcysteine decarboxylase/phosphopantothenate--cysteine ligase CoaBC [Candidatus Soleaferrea massiliensis]
MLTSKTILVGVTGGIAAYKTAQLVSDLVKLHADVHCIMTENATEFIAPLTFETLTGNKCIVDTFDRNFQWNVQHVSLAQKADLFVVAPATANIMAKLAFGLADDMLSTTFLACSCRKLIAPAMNTGMYLNPVTQRNLQLLRQAGMRIIEPASGRLACGDVGVGKLAGLEDIMDAVLYELAYEKDLKGLHILVTAGPTCEAVDPVRYITNHSSGKMGYEVAKAARMRGAEVVLVSGPTVLARPHGVEMVDVVSAQEMFEAVTSRLQSCDIVVKAAAVGDFRPVHVSEDKIKKAQGARVIELAENPDILSYIGHCKSDSQVVCGFSMETRDLIENSSRKLRQKNADMIVANNLTAEGAGFKGDTNLVTLLTGEETEELELMSKTQVAHRILDRLLFLYQKKNQ